MISSVMGITLKPYLVLFRLFWSIENNRNPIITTAKAQPAICERYPCAITKNKGWFAGIVLLPVIINILPFKNPHTAKRYNKGWDSEMRRYIPLNSAKQSANPESNQNNYQNRSKNTESLKPKSLICILTFD